MPAREHSASLALLRTLLDRGPYPIEATTLPSKVKSQVRSMLLRALRPYSYYQHEVDSAVLSSLIAHERDSHRIEMLESLVEDLVAAVETIRRRTAASEAVGSELRAVPYVAGSPFASFETPLGEATGYRASHGPQRTERDPTSAYAAFEDLFRGPAERVSELQRPYLELIAGHAPVLDLGCGRGEFLALLSAEGIPATGADHDPAMVECCRRQGLAVELADAGEHLAALADGGLGSVFSSQLIEHLPGERLRRLLAVARRKLAPGGLFIAETVNPHSIRAFKTFWIDPARRHPIFPEAALGLCAIAGYASAYVVAPGYERFESAKFESERYAVVAAAPAPAPR